MKPFLSVSIIVLVTLSACRTISATPALVSPQVQSPPGASETQPPPPSTPTLAIPTPTPTPTALPADFGRDNFSRFVQVRSFVTPIEMALGMDILDLRIDALAYSPDGRYIAVGGCTRVWSGNCQNPDIGPSDSFLFILDAITAEIIATLPETDVMITGLAFSYNGEKLVYAIFPARIVIWDIASGQVDKVLWQEGGRASYPKVAFSPDGTQVVSLYLNSMRVWDAASGDLLTEKPAVRYGSSMPQFSLDGSRLAVFTQDYGRELAIYDTATWQKIATISPPSSHFNAAAISPDGKLFVTVEEELDADVLLWDTETGALVGNLDEPIFAIDTLAFSPAGLLLVSGTMDDYRNHDVVSVWDVSTRQRLGGISGETSFRWILFSTDGTSFLVNDAFAFGRIYLWSLPDEQALAARQALVAFTRALNNGDYEAAAARFHLLDEEREWYASMGLDTTCPLALFTSLCVLDSQPCMPIEEVLYQGEQDDEIYTFLVRFSGPDGGTYMNLDGDTVFWMYAMIDQDGSVRVTFLPPFDYNP